MRGQNNREVLRRRLQQRGQTTLLVAGGKQRLAQRGESVPWRRRCQREQMDQQCPATQSIAIQPCLWHVASQ
jgi:hypothetical protein